MLGRSLALLAILSTPALAQGAAPPALGRSSTDYARALWREVSTYLIKAAADAPESLFAYKPTPEVRSFGETLDHVAASQNGYCHLALGQKTSRGGAGTGAKTKSEVVAALRASNEFCERAYAQADSEAALPAYDGDKRSRLYMLFENAMHDNEHYGNIVTYLRLNHLVPPSSQPAPSK
jgi:uncharacterized damage-inducible protein DinB